MINEVQLISKLSQSSNHPEFFILYVKLNSKTFLPYISALQLKPNIKYYPAPILYLWVELFIKVLLI